MDTSTRVIINGTEMKGLYFGRLSKIDLITYYVHVPSTFHFIPTNVPGITIDSLPGNLDNRGSLDMSQPGRVYGIVLNGEKLYEGNNILIQFAEVVGDGLVRLHSVGAIRYRGCWQFMKSHNDVQFYSEAGKNTLLTPSLSGQPELVKSLEAFARAEGSAPDISTLTEYVLEENTVKWINKFKLIGVIHTAEGDLLFHLKDISVKRFRRPRGVYIKDMSQAKFWIPIFPKPGQKVQFDIVTEDPTPDGQPKKSFSRRAVNVRW